MTARLITEVALIGLRRMWHAKLELLLVFVVPVVFFTIFAMIFTGGVGSGRTTKIKLAVENLDRGAVGEQLTERLAASDAVRIVDGLEGADDPLDRARDAVLHGQAAVSLVVPEGWTASLEAGAPERLFLLYDSSDQVAPKVMTALVQETIGAILTDRAAERAETLAAQGVRAPTPPPLPAVDAIDLLAEGKANPTVAMYAAGIAVMFLLFSATGAAGSLLEEEETQTLERLLASRLTMSHVLAGKWLQLTLVGAVQVSVMFAWAQIAFGLDVLRRLDGFLIMTVTTAAAAAALALLLAAACRTRAQLNAVSVILVLTMSALGGSMIPRYLMSESMQQYGRVTFNAWAIDGYTKLFWRDQPTVELWPELAVMAGSAVVMLVVARGLATRWESA
ncbi:ABC-2 family transporter protein [Botrimarina colliarenosi]|uniref:ABC-2 family transporter protein n=1 Tax=Botrimarina colliarenosi TaxID=2528001 RepID=A0A5C6ALN0_9BACT|nr:ABC transporter permease [Botrimarina colliarenosi]TWU00367.1 ABC-2 family transporter protein [Botrimarina colliarenosi]